MYTDARTEREEMQQPQPAVQVSLLDKFAETVLSFGQKIAISAPANQQTYQQLHQESNQIAHLLQQHAIQPGDVVAVVASATPQMVL